ncbi:CrcB family protein [Cellulomonas sp. HZM]|uniref:fluoride efflux transporter FluC n=1 Tax=Cellulomonas sp. HZM TaxID=1454010 RepID=UPI0004934E6C|nr:CrcB family protein [Cellulomonas sp. HZM]
MTWVLLALAGGIGAACRFWLDSFVGRRLRAAVPLGTIAVNVTACLAIGLLAGWLLVGHDDLRTVLGTGFLGGYSTFSTASVEGARLLRAGRPWGAAVHAGGMLLLSVAACWAGLLLSGA